LKPGLPQVFDLLVYLLQNRERVVSKDDLLASVWGGRIVSDATLDSRIAAARRAVGDSGAAQTLIRTFARKGVRFVGEVREDGKPAALAPELAAGPGRLELALPDRPSIAVLPFANLSGDSEQEYFVDGIVEDIITGLSRIRWLHVIARNSTFVYKGRAVDVKQIGRELGVRYVLEGSLRKAGSRVRLTAQLIEAASGRHVWAERYDRGLDDIFAVQDEITLSVVGYIEPSLRQAEIERAKRKRPDSLDAYDLYLRALPYAMVFMPGDADKALPVLRQSLELEPGFAAAHAAAAWCHEQRYLRGGLDPADKTAALAHARAALEAGADDAGTLATAGFVIGLVDHDYDTAMNAIDRGLAMSPSSALALSLGSVILGHAGRTAEAIDYAERALRWCPLDRTVSVPYVGLGIAHCAAGDWEAAIPACGKSEQACLIFCALPPFPNSAALRRPRSRLNAGSNWSPALRFPALSGPIPAAPRFGSRSATRCASWACLNSAAG
jgi:TolB-like protein